MNAAMLAAATVVVAGLALRPAPPGRDDTGPARPARPGRSHARPRHRRPRSAPGADEVARWCTDLARAVRSGATLTAAVRDVTPPAGAEARLADMWLALDRGAGLATALDDAAAHRPDDADLQLALTVVRACAEHGGPPGEPIDRAAATLRARAADLADRRTHSAQAQLSARVMTWLPVAMLTLLLVTSASVRGVLARPAGLAVIAAGVALNTAGSRWMRRIIGASR